MATPIPIECLSGEVFGCTYSNALNYDPAATFDDGSCVFGAIATGNTFEVTMFVTHAQECGDLAAFFLHIPTISGDTVPTDFNMFVEMTAMNFVYNTNGVPTNVQMSCAAEDYQNVLIEPIGNDNRTANNRKQVIYIDNLNPSFVNVFSVAVNDGDYVVGFSVLQSYIPIDITIYADGVKYTGSVDLLMHDFPTQVDDTFTVTVTQ